MVVLFVYSPLLKERIKHGCRSDILSSLSALAFSTVCGKEHHRQNVLLLYDRCPPDPAAREPIEAQLEYSNLITCVKEQQIYFQLYTYLPLVMATSGNMWSILASLRQRGSDISKFFMFISVKCSNAWYRV